jgi:hypothetical protein
MERTIWPAIMVLAVYALPGTVCGQTRPAPPTAPTTQARIEKLQEQIEDLRKEITALKSSGVDLAGRLFKIEMSQNPYENVPFDLTSRSFQRVDTSTGIFLVSVLEASTYLDGYRVVLNIGNPSFATYTDFKLKIEWNRKYDWEKYTAASFGEWRKATREKEVTYPEPPLKPGSWNRVEVLLPSTRDDELAYFVLSMETPTISLKTEP